MSRLTRAFVLLALAAALPVGSAQAKPLPVTNLNDSGEGSLRQAILGGNSNPGLDTVPIQVAGTINLETALPTINSDVAITGPGAGALTVRRASLTPFSIFSFNSGSSASSISGITVKDGFQVGLGQAGAGIYNSGGGSLTLTGVAVTGNRVVSEGGMQAVVRAAGIYSSGPLTLRESVVSGNRATASGGTSQTVATGGGVETFGALTVERSTISGNVAEAFGEGGAQVVAKGGGLLVLTGPVTIAQSTISGNLAEAVEGSSQNVAQGGGIQGTGVDITGSTISGNAVASDEVASGANLQHFSATTVRDSIVANPFGDASSCNGTIVSGGFNIDEDGSCNFEAGSDREGMDPALDPVLRDNGGPTPTHALLPDSPAIDKGNAFGATADQRGLTRPLDFPTIGNLEGGDGSDIGAFELQSLPAPDAQPPPPAAVIVALVASDRTPPNTRIVKGPARLTSKRVAKFHFVSTEPQASFQCKVDNTAWRGCKSPHRRKVSAGAKHVFKVRAIDRFGNVDPTPARFGWRVKEPGS